VALRDVFETGTAQQVFAPATRLGPLPGGPWPESPDSALILPIAAPGYVRPAGFMVIGLSPRLVFDAEYRSFLDLLAGKVATAIANARAYEEERSRAAALAEIDRAKTVFFSNVSHEFRTPLTLILAPLEDALAQTTEPAQRERLELLQRNALRLQKLVNTLLDFSRLEAGRMRATFEPTDLAALTAELASTFRSAIESAGMRLRMDCSPLRELVYVDREMWEKIVLNLLSNAFKFTLQGEIAISLRDVGESVQLSVSDTGSGIAEDQLPHIFERFHRVEGTRARTHEGSGIGLAFVHELVKLHGGDVRVDSVWEKGTTFTVTIPWRAKHPGALQLAPHHTVASATPITNDYIEEARRWLPRPATTPNRESTSRFRVVWADDNADMRDYVGRLLSDRYDVEAVADGAAALNAVRRELPDLVLADIMMPVLDGFGLLREVRADERTQGVPVILLSARAGEEAQVEGPRGGSR
jgi:signal transduction histidine kinase/CheY-like chemotaxis protein